MKKFLIVLALLASVQVANAQVSVGAAKKAVEAAVAASQNEKKAAKVATWMKLAQTYMDAYNAPAANVLQGTNLNELKLVMGSEKPVSEENVVLNGAQFLKQVYDNKNLYFNGNGQLEIIEVTKPVIENALPKALEAYKKAYEIDTKATKVKDIANGIKTISEKLTQEAYNAYSLGDIKKAESFFEAAVEASCQKPYEKIDTSSLYNAGFTSWSLGDYGKAKTLFDKCLDYGYFAENGEVYAKLADCAAKLDTSKAGQELSKDYLEKGFTKFPGSQSLLIGLINYYVTSGENTGRLFELLNEAKKNEPNNASLYYVEGNIHSKLGEIEEAVKSYRQCSEIDPNYEYGYIGEGILRYNQAIELQDLAQNEMDDAKYTTLVQEFETVLKQGIEPFEKAYSVCKDEGVKSSIAEYLKNIYYRFREQGAEYQAGYDKYNGILNK